MIKNEQSQSYNRIAWSVRPMVSADLPQVLTIEQACYPQPWTVDLFNREFDNPLSQLLVCHLGDEILGYLCLWDIAGEVEIHNVATNPNWRRHGVADYLMDALMDYMGEKEIDRAFLEVRSRNNAAIALYEKYLFRVTDQRKGYYSDGEDALLMCWTRDNTAI